MTTDSGLPQSLDELAAIVKSKGIHLFIATPAFGCKLTSKYVLSLMRLHSLCMAKGIGLTIDFLGNESLITRGRCILAARFLLSKATHLLFLDADIGFEPISIMRMAAFDRDVVCGIYCKKHIDWNALRHRIRENVNPDEGIQSKGLDFNLNLRPDAEGKPGATVRDGFARVYDAATGCMLISRKTLDMLTSRYKESLQVVNDIPGSKDTVPTYVALFETEICPETRRFLSEDYAFVRKCQREGLDVWADLSAPLTHTGTIQLHGDAMQRTMVSYMR